MCWLARKEAFGWLECKIKRHVSFSERNVWIHGEILEAEVKDEAFGGIVDVERVTPLNHIWGEVFVTDMKATRFNGAWLTRIRDLAGYPLV